MRFSLYPPWFVAFSLLFSMVPAALTIIGFKYAPWPAGWFFLLVWLAYTAAMVYSPLYKSLTIDARGVKYQEFRKSYELSWEKIKRVGVGYMSAKVPGAKPWIYFTSGEYPCPELSGQMIGATLLMIRYRKKVAAAIRSYCPALNGLAELRVDARQKFPKIKNYYR